MLKILAWAVLLLIGLPFGPVGILIMFAVGLIFSNRTYPPDEVGVEAMETGSPSGCWTYFIWPSLFTAGVAGAAYMGFYLVSTGATP